MLRIDCKSAKYVIEKDVESGLHGTKRVFIQRVAFCKPRITLLVKSLTRTEGILTYIYIYIYMGSSYTWCNSLELHIF